MDQLEENYNGIIDLKGAFTGYLPGDNPLLEELSINLGNIKSESLLPWKILTKNTADLKVSTEIIGPIIILILFTLSLLLQGKLRFGYIYLISLTSSFLIFVLLNLITPVGVKYTTCCNIMGYSMAPIVGFSVISMLLIWTGYFIRSVLGVVMCIWSAYTATSVVCIYFNLFEQTIVVGYPMFLAYMCFTMMILF